jgi:Non-classical export protein 1
VSLAPRLIVSTALITNYPFASAADPLLGIFTGALAFYLYEINPRTAPEPEQRLENLVRWKIEKYQAGRAKGDSEGASSDAEWSKSFTQAKDK